MTRELILLRHGQTTYNAGRRMQGQLDTHLSDHGREQARVIGKKLANRGITRIISSDLSRAHDTAELVAAEIAATEGREPFPITTDARLRETHLGEWQGRQVHEVDAETPHARAHWRHDPTWAPPGGESRVQVAQRARQVVDELMADYPEWNHSTVLLVAHGGMIASLTAQLLGFEVPQYPLLSGLANTHYAKLTSRPVFEPEAPEKSMAFNEDNIDDARWYLDAWNVGV